MLQCGNKGILQDTKLYTKTSKPSYKSPSEYTHQGPKGFQPKFTTKLIQSSSNSNSQADTKFQKDYKAKYKKMKAKLALLKASPSSSQNPKIFQPKNKVLESQAVNESLEPTKTLNTPESSKDSKAESLTSLPPLKNL
ncbi:hypothetical protein Tco_0866295 [Tanacetum coccineum]